MPFSFQTSSKKEASALSKEVVCTLNRSDNSMERITQAKTMLRLDLTIQYTGNTTREFRVNWMATDDGTKVAQKSSSFQCGSYEEKQDLRYTVNSQDNHTVAVKYLIGVLKLGPGTT